jgi:hypothetical protein
VLVLRGGDVSLTRRLGARVVEVASLGGGEILTPSAVMGLFSKDQIVEECEGLVSGPNAQTRRQLKARRL